MTHHLRYLLLPKAKKTTCPACGSLKRFKPYVDTTTGEAIGDKYGRCDRAVSCGYDLRPTNAEPRLNSPQVKLPPLPKPLAILPEDIVAASMARFRENNLARLLASLIGYGQADELLRGFEVGTSSHWPGATVFFLRDEYGRARTGQVAHFDLVTGHTLKDRLPNGSTKRRTTWLHETMRQAQERKHQPLPQWVLDSQQAEQKSHWLYGLRSALAAHDSLPIAVVESPKTAVLCNAFFPAYRWVAVGGLSYLTKDRLRPLLCRTVVLFPDTSEKGTAFTMWQVKAAELRRFGFTITVNDALEQLATPQQRAAGYDLADIILEGYRGYPPSWDEK